MKHEIKLDAKINITPRSTKDYKKIVKAKMMEFGLL